MADQKISELTALTGANVADDDAIAIVDTSATETKKIVFSELKNALDTATGFVRITGDTMTGDLSMGDNVKAIFGAGSDLQIYHDGSNSYIADTGAGDLLIRSSNDLWLQNAAGTETYARFDEGASTYISYAGSTKLTTTSTGIDVTGALHVEGAFTDTTQGVVANFDSGNAGIGSGPIVKWTNDFAEAAVTMLNTASGSSALTFETMSSSSLAERMRINGDGDLILGGNAPVSSSQANGSLIVRPTLTGSAQTLMQMLNNLNTTATGGKSYIDFYNGSGVEIGSITGNQSGLSYNTSSDHRLKENVVELTGATTRLKQLEPKRFNFIADADNTVVDGFIAHEVQSVVPEAVTGTHNEVDADGNPVYQGIDQSKLVPLLVATIQELEARITALENA